MFIRRWFILVLCAALTPYLYGNPFIAAISGGPGFDNFVADFVLLIVPQGLQRTPAYPKPDCLARVKHPPFLMKSERAFVNPVSTTGIV